MEKHEEGSDVKAQEIIQKHEHLFRYMDYTVHTLRENEQRGKASNVSWCGEHLDEISQKHGIDLNNVLITIIDADSWVPPLYITKVEEYMSANPDNKDLAIFVPAQIFTRNYLEVPVFTRIYDHTHSMSQLSNMRSFSNLIFPISNYSLSYNLIKFIGFWDTCQDAIGEDFHTNQKAHWKTQGKSFNVPIYVPFNQVNVQTGKGYMKDVEARFWQAERHAQGCADVAYNINMLLKTQLWTFKSILMTYFIAECFILPAVMPWIAVSTFLQNNVYFYFWEKPEGIIPIPIMFILMNVSTLLSMSLWGSYEIFKRYTNKKLFHKENESLWRLGEYLIAVSVDITFISIPTFIIAAFRVLMKNREYRVAEKIFTK